ncbi:PASTA domain-containing protein [Streptomyces sp. cg28]|uniref:PASTA domain-containing protein n=1 Tax=Streptomyces sp. cg28 TaxID=3403457 RepID=UPI003B20DA64
MKTGLGYSLDDATDLGRTVDPQHLDLWQYCLQRNDEAQQAVDFAGVPFGEKCPTRWHAHVPTPKTPDVGRVTFEDAYSTLLAKGYSSSSIAVIYGGGEPVSPEDVSRVHGQVCKQYPRAGVAFNAEENVRLYVAVGQCPHA